MNRFALSALLLFGTVLGAQTYEIDPAHSAAQFTVKHMMVTNVRGQLGKVTGMVNWDAKNAANTKISATIDVNGISTGEAKRDAHLKAPDFFDAEKYPTVQFTSTKVEKAGAGRLKVAGNLTMHGVTKPVVLDVETDQKEIKSAFGDLRGGATATTKINRKDWGLTWNKALETGGVVVSDEVSITLDIQVRRPAAATTQTNNGQPAKSSR